MRILICGFMGCGKTTFLERLKNQTDRKNNSHDFIDLDRFIHEKHALPNESMAQMIERLGWEDFRESESNSLKALLAPKDFENSVIALGGGSLEHNWNWLAGAKAKGEFALVWLNTPFELCLKRARNQGERPLLQKSDQELFNLYSQRLPRYQKADLWLDEKRQNQLQTVEQLQECLES